MNFWGNECDGFYFRSLAGGFWCALRDYWGWLVTDSPDVIVIVYFWKECCMMGKEGIWWLIILLWRR